MYSGTKGGSNYYHHADVVSRNHHLALKAAKEGRVRNWRWIDTFDTASKDYRTYELLGRIEPDGAKNPRRPTPHKLLALEKRVKKIDGVLSANMGRRYAFVLLAQRSPKLRQKVNDLLYQKFQGKVRFGYSRR
ncbi:MAG: hypothetical protein A3H69_00810 [Candidatus Sungbacteria bacterium RIFCSPLOWO2_02_FULL_47_9]|uniref:Uncharacterized protein n=1 Tax=Candidatus Sungbacteria bacterium RIFCSPHIGHO2_01_FULL_47_32 TaxID=1802264 RepID=A0A1G2K4P5_9BACT|nr:MAG: hypothetical protein UX72_C0016G0020 [Parcubacteria group bacterium GW2011_GWA2_47_10]OGZ94386.1 MAG: hypothetical protein A2633_02160 [Candidatus Sungbacteria bacterium RIFCSPHIGHO2_01_FULL_47_32]OGZ98360.1 MAG: hypothetical protein A3D57_02135 [Candidatus Sungbacteria bacterium RIFCSPHIGHO2_02_FULL_46_12]OHA04959.1 MAG: hypothetical protein A3A28_02515 [Candidatus Sungbacteria bacterium RIFCSPLOWO2_01_FULL_47_32]OHA11838.1 MAG: hypothetical protein A3H69_00810 [Candidatus Sungbacteria